MPGERLKNLRELRAQGRKHQPYHDGAAFDVMRPRPEDEVSFGLPAEIIPLFLLRRKNSVQVRNQSEVLRGSASARQDEVIPPLRVGRRHKLRSEAEPLETFRR